MRTGGACCVEGAGSRATGGLAVEAHAANSGKANSVIRRLRSIGICGHCRSFLAVDQMAGGGGPDDRGKQVDEGYQE